MKILKLTFNTQYLSEMVAHCVPGKELEAIAQKLGAENACDVPYFKEALAQGGYFRGETPDFREKVKAFVDIEEIEVIA